MFSKWIFLPEMYVLQAFPTLMLLCRFLVFSVCTNPCSMPLIHSTLSYFRHGYWRKRIKTRLQYHSYEITFCLLFFFFFRYWMSQSHCWGFSLKSQGCGSMSWVKLPLFSLCPSPGHSPSGATASPWDFLQEKDPSSKYPSLVRLF